jgi:dynein intermediate chain 1, axonemal
MEQLLGEVGDFIVLHFLSYFVVLCCSMVQVFSLKNVGFPEYSFSCDSGVMCLDFHPTFHALLAVGCYDGTVRIYDIRKQGESAKPVFTADIKSGKHSDPVWEVRWAPDGARLLASGGDASADPAAAAGGGAAAAAEAASKDLMLYSISSDGQVASWVVAKSELKMETAMLLKLVSGGSGAKDSAKTNAGGAEGQTNGGGAGAAPAANAAAAAAAEEEGRLTGLASGCCFAFNPFQDHV